MALPEPLPIDPDRSAKRVNRAMFFLGAALFISGARFFLVADALERTSVGRALTGPFDELWSLAFTVGGALIMSGVGLRRPRLELPGVTLAATGILVNGAAIVVTNGAAAASQLPLYVLAMWVLDGRRRDLRELPHDRRRHRSGPRPDGARLERRINAAAFPLGAFAAAPAGPSLTTTLIAALLGGGIVTALVQALMYRPQRRDLEAKLSDTAVSAAGKALEASERRADQLEEELVEARARIAALERRITELEDSVDGVDA